MRFVGGATTFGIMTTLTYFGSLLTARSEMNLSSQKVSTLQILLLYDLRLTIYGAMTHFRSILPL